MSSYWCKRGPYSSFTGVLIKRRNLETDTHTHTRGDRPCEDRDQPRDRLPASHQMLGQKKMFGINGVGGLYLNSITFQDYDFFMLLSGFYTLVSLTAGIVIDISYGFIDPRIRMGAK